MSYSHVPRIGCGAVDPSAGLNRLFGNGMLARSVGRNYPCVSGDIILWAIPDLFSEDDIGVAFPAGTAWVIPIQYVDDGPPKVLFYPVGVPLSLPTGYTATTQRNVWPLETFRPGGHTPYFSYYPYTSPYGLKNPSFPPTYTQAKCIRGTDSVSKYLTSNPASSYGFRKGPHNSGKAVAGFTGVSLYGSDQTLYMSLHPGWRNVRVYWRVTYTQYALYLGGGGDAIVTVDGNGANVSVADLVDQGDGYWLGSADAGASNMAAAGELTQAVVVCRTDIPAPYAGYGVGTIECIGSPRVDIPLPWASVGEDNLLVLGGRV